MSALTVECPECQEIITAPDGHSIEAAVAVHDRTCRPLPALPGSAQRIQCPDCGRHLATIQARGDWHEQVRRLRSLHVCRTPTRHTPAPKPTPIRERTPIMHAVTTPPPEKRPPAKDLTTHPDARIRRQAAKVLAEAEKLTALWDADRGKAELRAEIARLEAELKAKKARLRGSGAPGAPEPATVLPWPAIRAWAAAEGIDCPATGKVPMSVLQAWRAAGEPVAS